MHGFPQSIVLRRRERDWTFVSCFGMPLMTRVVSEFNFLPWRKAFHVKSQSTWRLTMTMGAVLEESLASLQKVRRSIFDESLKVVDLTQPTCTYTVYVPV